MSHLMREELIRWRDGQMPDDRDRIVSHLASCGSCAAAYAEVVRTAPLETKPVRFDPADFVQRGYAVRKAPKASWASSLTNWKVWTAGLSAAAAILVAVLVLPGPPGGTGTRGGTIEFVAAAPSQVAYSIEWKSGLAATNYRVELVDRDGRVLFTSITDTTRASLPPDAVAQLRPEGAYEWRVTALEGDGTAMTTGVTPLLLK